MRCPKCWRRLKASHDKPLLRGVVPEECKADGGLEYRYRFPWVFTQIFPAQFLKRLGW